MDSPALRQFDGIPFVELRYAIQLIYHRLEAQFHDKDPVPWLIPESDPFFGSTFEQKLNWLAPFVAHCALLEGKLVGHVFNSHGHWVIPAWQWSGAGRFHAYWILGQLPISPLMPAFSGFAGEQVYLEQGLFGDWCEADEYVPAFERPKLPPAKDIQNRPPFSDYREPADYPWVSLTEACTWIAYQCTLDFDELAEVEQGDEIQFFSKKRFDHHEQGLASLLTAAGGLHPKLRLIGVHFENYISGDHGAATEFIEPMRLIDYCKPDWMRDGLRWSSDNRRPRGVADLAMAMTPRDGYRYVKVDRAELMAAFPPERIGKPNTSGQVAMPTGDPGRPTKGKQLYLAEHKRRCETGEAQNQLSDEAKYLVDWYIKQYPLHDPVSQGAVQNNIRSQHNQYGSQNPRN